MAREPERMSPHLWASGTPGLGRDCPPGNLSHLIDHKPSRHRLPREQRGSRPAAVSARPGLSASPSLGVSSLYQTTVGNGKEKERDRGEREGTDAAGEGGADASAAGLRAEDQESRERSAAQAALPSPAPTPQSPWGWPTAKRGPGQECCLFNTHPPPKVDDDVVTEIREQSCAVLMSVPVIFNFPLLS